MLQLSQRLKTSGFLNTGTCHNWIDYTAEGKAWAEEYRQQLYEKAKE